MTVRPVSLALATVATAVALTACTGAGTTAGQGAGAAAGAVATSSATITNEPLAANTPEDEAPAKEAITAYLANQGLHDPRFSRPGFGTSDDIPPGWFKKHPLKPYKVISFIADAGQGGSREYVVICETESSSWEVYGWD